jgi:hypothetical protein
MRKLVLMAILIVTAVIPWWFARERSRRNGLRWTVGAWVAFIVVWALYGPRIFFMYPPTDE